MGKISNYARVLVSKLTDVFACDQTDNGTTETKSATVEQIGMAIGTLQNFADLDTSNKNLVDAINEIASYTPVYGNTASGAIATFDTSLSLPLQDLQIEINGTNLTGANIKVVGANQFDKTQSTANKRTNNGVITNSTNNSISEYIKVKPNTSYYVMGALPSATGEAIAYYDDSKTYISRNYLSTGNGTITTPATAVYAIISYPTANEDSVGLNYPATDTAYHAYNANSTTTAISWSDLGTVSEGSLNVTTGKLTVVNGSMGAGEYQITPIPINQLSGTNNIFCDTGNTSVVYACSLKDYIDSQ